MTILFVILILVFLIVVHELGHFIAAKLSKVKVEEFGIGYPPRAFTFGRIGGTEYTLNWIPFGGFVRLFGDEGEGQRGRGSLIDAPKWKQAIILIAGVTMNLVAAWALYVGAIYLGVPHVVETVPDGTKARLLVSEVLTGSPAQIGGLAPGDEIISMEDQYSVAVKELTPSGVVDYVRKHPGKPISVTYSDRGEIQKSIMIPANAVIPSEAAQPALGVGLVLVANQSETFGEAFVDAFPATWNALRSVAHDLWTLARGIVGGAPDLSGVVGPVGIVSFVGDAAQNGIGAVFSLAAIVSINLAIINLLPIPALDGGRLFVLIIEAIIRRPAPRLSINVINAVGISLIVLLMVVVTYHDIARMFV
jgi:regulator of sigma E protease